MSRDILDFNEEQYYMGTEKNVGFGIRLAASIIDYFLLMIVQYIFIFSFYGSFDEYIYAVSSDMAVIYLISALVGVAYYSGMWAYADGATVGKKLVKIKIVSNEDGSDIGLGAALLRYLGYMISSIPCGLGFLWVIWDDEKRGWHDKISNTKVVSAE